MKADIAVLIPEDLHMKEAGVPTLRGHCFPFFSGPLCSAIHCPKNSAALNPGWVVVCNFSQAGAAKVILGKKKEVVQALRHDLPDLHLPDWLEDPIGGVNEESGL